MMELTLIGQFYPAILFRNRVSETRMLNVIILPKPFLYILVHQ
jgi:hypothetical protein